MKELPDVTFYLAGDGRYREEIIPELRGNKNFIWLKNLRYPEEVKKFFSEIDIFLLLSGLEGLGQSVIESLLMRKPTIASDVGGIPELIVNNETGILVKNGDSKIITDSITRLIENPEFVRDITETGYKKIVENHSWERLSDEFIKIIHQNSRKRD